MATTSRTRSGEASGQVFPISLSEADRVVADVFSETFPRDQVTRSTAPNISYKAYIRLAFDWHTVVVTLTPAIGALSDGTHVDGVAISLNHGGSTIITGPTRAKKAFRRIIADASAITAPVKFVRYGSLSTSSKAASVDVSPREPAPSLPVVSTGTCFVASTSGRAVTAYHVVEDAQLLQVRLSNGETTSATVEYKDARNDVAVLRLESQPQDVLPLASARRARLGSPVFTVGFPAEGILGKAPKYTSGTVSSLSGIADEASLLQISVPVQPGNSGGPLVTDDGHVIGLITSTAHVVSFLQETGSLPQNINWAVKSDYVRPLLAESTDLPDTASRAEAIRRTEKAVCAVRAVRRL